MPRLISEPPPRRTRRNRLALIRYSHIVSSAVRDLLERAPFEAAGGAGLTMRQIDLLEFVAITDRSVDAIAGFMHVTPSAAARSVSPLERHGLVAHRSENEDGSVLACTPKGRNLLARYRTLQEEALSAAVESFGDDELDEVTRVLERWSLALMAIGEKAAGPCLRCGGFYDADCLLQRTRACAFPKRGR